MRADGLARGERVPLGLICAPLGEQELGEAPLALAERRAVLERREDPDRLSEEALRTHGVALLACDDRGEVDGAPERPGGTGLLEMPTCRLEGCVGLVELAAVQVELAGEPEGAAARLGAAALLGEENRALDQRRGAVELEAGKVDAGELVGGLALEVLPARFDREVVRLAHDLLLLGEVAQCPGDRRASPEGSEAPGEIVGLEDLERLVDHRLRGLRVGIAQDRRLGEGHQRAALRPPVVLGDRCREDFLHLSRDRRQVAQAVGCARGEVAAPQRRLELDRAHEEVPSGAVRFAREGTQACLGQRLGRVAPELVRHRAVQLGGQFRGMVEVIGTDLQELVARAFLQPLGERGMVIGPRGLRDAAVSDLADEHVLELVGLLAADRRALLWNHEVAEEQVLEQLVERLELRREPLDRARPEDPADHGGALENRLLLERKPVDAGCDQRLHRVRDPVDRVDAFLGEHSHRLLDEEGVALGLVEQALARRFREIASAV